MGRESELAALREALPGRSGPAVAALIGGEPGSGKSRLVRELASIAAGDGIRVAYGACDAEVPVPYGPFAQALEPVVGEAAGPQLAPLLGRDLAGKPVGDPDAERLRLHRAAAAALSQACEDRPLVLVLEDVHWADGATIALLRQLLRSPASERLLLIATYRDAPADVGTDLAAAVAEMRRSEAVLHLRLRGLSAADVGRWVRRVAGAGEDAALGGLPEELLALTAGNPFMLGELWRSLDELDALRTDAGGVRLDRSLAGLASPDGVRDVVGDRLGRVDPGVRAVLELAAVAGPEFRVDVIHRALASAPEGAPAGPAAALAHAEGLGMVEPVPPSAVSYRFAHELVRRAVVERLPGLRRAELHLSVATAMEELGAAGPAELAHHFTAAAAVGGAERAVAHGRAAARAAAAAAAHDQAAVHLARVRELTPSGAAERTVLSLELGEEQTRAGDAPGALDSFREAAALARADADARVLARAAIGFEEACWRPGITDAGAVEILEEAERALERDDALARDLVRVRCGLARALAYRGEYARAERIAAGAVADARALDDPSGLARALVATFFAAGGRPSPELAADLAEAHEVARRAGHREVEIEADIWRMVVLTRMGDAAGARERLVAVQRAGEQTGLPFVLHVAEQAAAALALAEGRLADSEAAAERSREWGEQLRGRDSHGVYGIQVFNVRREQGRLGELAALARILAAEAGEAWRPGLVALLAETGLDEEARAQLGALLRDGTALRDEGGIAVAGLAYLAEAAVTLGDVEAARALRPALAARAGEVLMVANLVACLGAAERLEGMLAATEGDHEAAVALLETAIARDAELGFATWVAWGAHGLARALRGRGAPGDRERAAQLDARASQMAERHGLAALAARVAAAAAPPAPDPGDLSPREIVVLRLLARGRSNREIGRELHISEHTAANHVRSILRKTGSANRTEAADRARRLGVIDTPAEPV